MSQDAVFEREALVHLQALRNYASSLCRDAYRSDDLVQETMLKAYRHFDSYQQGSNCRAWLFQICKHCFINDCRRRRYEPVATDLEGGWTGADDDGTSMREVQKVASEPATEEAESSLLSDEVVKALDSVPADYQTVLILGDIEGYSYEEIAEFVSAPVGTIRSRMHRGRKMLARRLAGYARNRGYRGAVASPRMERQNAA